MRTAAAIRMHHHPILGDYLLLKVDVSPESLVIASDR